MTVAARTKLRMQTLAMTFAEIQREEPGSPWNPLGNFMMDFFRNFPHHRADLIAEPIQVLSQIQQPETEREKDLHQWAVFCAASAEYLAHQYGLSCPQWVHDPVYGPLAEPWYFAPTAGSNERVRERYERTTPEEFAKRNIFCGNRVFVDKRAEAARLRRARLN